MYDISAQKSTVKCHKGLRNINSLFIMTFHFDNTQTILLKFMDTKKYQYFENCVFIPCCEETMIKIRHNKNSSECE